MVLPKFEESARCVKCNAQGAIVLWVATERRNQAYADRSESRGYRVETVVCAQEHILRTCRRCGFAWKEAPLDS